MHLSNQDTPGIGGNKATSTLNLPSVVTPPPTIPQTHHFNGHSSRPAGPPPFWSLAITENGHHWSPPSTTASQSTQYNITLTIPGFDSVSLAGVSVGSFRLDVGPSGIIVSRIEGPALHGQNPASRVEDNSQGASTAIENDNSGVVWTAATRADPSVPTVEYPGETPGGRTVRILHFISQPGDDDLPLGAVFKRASAYAARYRATLPSTNTNQSQQLSAPVQPPVLAAEDAT